MVKELEEDNDDKEEDDDDNDDAEVAKDIRWKGIQQCTENGGGQDKTLLTLVVKLDK